MNFIVTAYESVFIIRPDLDDEALSGTCDRIADVITSNKGTVIALEKVGNRRLSYEVKGFHDGFYVILNYEGEAAATNELERLFKISENVIRYLIVKREVPYKKPERPAAHKPKAEGEGEETAEGVVPDAPVAEPPTEPTPETAAEAVPAAAPEVDALPEVDAAPKVDTGSVAEAGVDLPTEGEKKE